MNRRIKAMALLGLAVVFATAVPQIGFAQSNPLFNSLIGTWKLDLAKSTFSPGVGPRSQTITYEAEGQALRATVETVDAQGGATKVALTLHNDGKYYPVRTPFYDAAADKVVNNTTVWAFRTKAGKVVQTLIGEVSGDGKTSTVTTVGVAQIGQPLYNVAVYERQ